VRLPRDDRPGVYSDRLLRLVLLRQLHEEGWYKEWRENGWLNHTKELVANRNLWERLLEITQRHQKVRWRKIKGHAKTGGAHKSGNDRADELAVAAKKETDCNQRIALRPPGEREAPKRAGEAARQ
jgi:ribonuclease HI